MTVPPGYDPSDYPPFAVTVDIALLTNIDVVLHILLVERGEEPFKGRWALPGGFVNIDEDLPDAAVRELNEETGMSGIDLEQLGAYGEPDRDPRMRVVTVAYWALLDDPGDPVGGDDAAAAMWVPVDEALADPDRLASDHFLIIGDAARRVLSTD